VKVLHPALLVVTLVTCAAPSFAFERGDTCTIKSSLSITVKRPNGTLELTLDKGTDIEVISVSDGGSTLIFAGDLKGVVSTLDLEHACAGTLRACKLKDPVMMFEQNRSDSKSWRVKPGAEVMVLKKGKTWAAVRVGDLQGFVKSPDIANACVAVDDDADGDDGPTEAVERGEGPGVLLLPFDLEGAAPAGDADALLDELFNRVAFYRPDAGRLGVEGSRDIPWKDRVVAAAKRAKRAETAYVIVGRIAIEPKPADKPASEWVDRYLLQLALVDAKTGKVVKGVKAHPTMRAQDQWAENALAVLIPPIPAAPGSKLPVGTKKEGLELAPNVGEQAPVKKSEAPVQESTEAPWFANVWGYLLLGAAAGAGAGAAVAGNFALAANDDANDAVQNDPRRAELRNTALTGAVVSDSLSAVAVGSLVAGVVVFATRAGLDD
jgi:hypothetical protein